MNASAGLIRAVVRRSSVRAAGPTSVTGKAGMGKAERGDHPGRAGAGNQNSRFSLLDHLVVPNPGCRITDSPTGQVTYRSGLRIDQRGDLAHSVDMSGKTG